MVIAQEFLLGKVLLLKLRSWVSLLANKLVIAVVVSTGRHHDNRLLG